jgi:hypothetical protein
MQMVDVPAFTRQNAALAAKMVLCVPELAIEFFDAPVKPSCGAQIEPPDYADARG